MQKTHHSPYERCTLPLRGTASRLEVQLDHPAALAVAYARDWLRYGPASTGQDPLASGVIRRALQLLVTHLNHPDLDPAAEARAIKQACGALTVDADDRQAAIQRLRGRAEGQPFPTWLDVLHGPGHASRWADLEDRVDELLRAS